jgi:hypothetical protein
MKKTNSKKLQLDRETIANLTNLRGVVGGMLSGGATGAACPVANMFPYSNGYPTQCLAGTGCGTLSGACC